MIIIFGSISMDVYINVPGFPEPDMPVMAKRHVMDPGGMGANQALAAARCGAKTALVGKVGNDEMSHHILNSLKSNEVMTSGVARSDSLPTGMNFIVKNAEQEKKKTVSMSANSEISNVQVPDEIMTPENMIVLQMEVPREENIALMERAKMNGTKVLLNLAPAIAVTKQELRCLDYLVVNQVEARGLARSLGVSAEDNYDKIAEALARTGELTCIVTMGDKGSVAVTEKGQKWVTEALPCEEFVDNAGAGDCYTGTLAAALHDRKSLPEALRMASVAAGLCCQKKKAQDSFPYLGEIEEHLGSIPAPESDSTFVS